jgi:putative endopeptidase
MTPQTVNAYYSPVSNRIVFPAAILQPPFFDFLADDAANYGGIGVVIGHEMTHGFDDEGSQFGPTGNLENWWTDADNANFKARIARIIAQYSDFTVPSGEHVQGGFVAGEAASDLGGSKMAYNALQKVLAAKGRSVDANGFTDEQRFFIAFAQLWASKVTVEYADFQVANDPHPPEQFRVIGTVQNLPEFAQAFGLAADCPMQLPAEKRCQLW